MSEHSADYDAPAECRYPCPCGLFPEDHCACMDGHPRVTSPGVGDDLQIGVAAREEHRRMLDPDSGRIDNWTEGSTDR